MIDPPGRDPVSSREQWVQGDTNFKFKGVNLTVQFHYDAIGLEAWELVAVRPQPTDNGGMPDLTELLTFGDETMHHVYEAIRITLEDRRDG